MTPSGKAVVIAVTMAIFAQNVFQVTYFRRPTGLVLVSHVASGWPVVPGAEVPPTVFRMTD